MIPAAESWLSRSNRDSFSKSKDKGQSRIRDGEKGKGWAEDWTIPRKSTLGSHGALAREFCVKPEHRETCPGGMKHEAFILSFPPRGTEGRCPACHTLLAAVTRR